MVPKVYFFISKVYPRETTRVSILVGHYRCQLPNRALFLHCEFSPTKMLIRLILQTTVYRLSTSHRQNHVWCVTKRMPVVQKKHALQIFTPIHFIDHKRNAMERLNHSSYV